MRELVLDTETTGLDPNLGHRIIEIGILEMKNKVLTGDKFHFYINPERSVPMEAYRIHGLSTEFLADKPVFAHIADDFLNFIDGGKLVIHNAAFDMKFINYELSLLDKQPIDIAHVIDTLTMARKRFPGAKVNLDSLCTKFKIDNRARKFHGALLDAELLSEVYVELTGGRQTAFIMSGKEQKIEKDYKQTTSNFAKTLVIEPSEEEVEAHRAFLQKIPSSIWENV